MYQSEKLVALGAERPSLVSFFLPAAAAAPAGCFWFGFFFRFFEFLGVEARSRRGGSFPEPFSPSLLPCKLASYLPAAVSPSSPSWASPSWAWRNRKRRRPRQELLRRHRRRRLLLRRPRARQPPRRFPPASFEFSFGFWGGIRGRSELQRDCGYRVVGRTRAGKRSKARRVRWNFEGTIGLDRVPRSRPSIDDISLFLPPLLPLVSRRGRKLSRTRSPLQT